MIKKEKATVTSNEAIAEDIYRLSFTCSIAAGARPGQFVNFFTGDRSRLLPRPISVCDANPASDSITVVYRVVGEGTRLLSGLSHGDTVSIMGPLGNGYFDAIEKKYGQDISSLRMRPLLVGGGLGIPPMLYLAKSLRENNIRFDCVLGYRDYDLLRQDFEVVSDSLYFSSDDGSIGTKGNVLDAIKANDIEPELVLACGPRVMLAALKDHCDRNDIDLLVSLEERMACGVGACLGCVAKSMGIDSHSMVHNKRVCRDGPVFDAGEVVL